MVGRSPVPSRCFSLYSRTLPSHRSLVYNFCRVGLLLCQARLGVTECASHELLSSYPVMFAGRGSIVAHFRCTVLLLPSGTSKVRPAQHGFMVKRRAFLLFFHLHQQDQNSSSCESGVPHRWAVVPGFDSRRQHDQSTLLKMSICVEKVN